MNLAHVHIVINHVPSLGTAVAVCLLVLALVQKNEGLKRVSFQVLVAMALMALPTYMTGNAAQGILDTKSDVTKGLIEAHQNAAIGTLILMTITGTFAWFGLWQFRRFSRPGFGTTSAVLLFSLLTAAAILRTANMGGDINHVEIRVAGTEALPVTGWQEAVAKFSNDHSWVWPASETVHFIGMALLFGVALLVNLRMLGMMKSIPFSAVHRLLPLGIFGFVINVISGMVFFMANPPLYWLNPGFEAKIALLLLAGIGVVYFTLFDKPWAVGPEQDAPLSAKIVAASTMSLLLGVMYFGRILPFVSH
jgi:hypothetical protein